MTIPEHQLNSFDPLERKRALEEIISKEPIQGTSTDNVNLHIHSFFSYHCHSWSPSRIALEARRNGLYAAGIIDFDVLDGQNEFLEASLLLGIRSSVGIETRAFHTGLPEVEIDSPGEPGISYIAGAGFVTPLPQRSEQAQMLENFRTTARERNLALIRRINEKLPEITIDYDTDVLPLTPSGNATERHIVQAYIRKSVLSFPSPEKQLKFWCELLDKPEEEMNFFLMHSPQLEDLVRSKLAKKGGIGYVQPTSESFPKVEDFFGWVRSCGAIPLESWLDGTSAGESDPEKLLALGKEKGAAGLNIIPDRNWNIKDPESKARKYKKLQEIVEVANRMDFPLHIGTEMNRLGLPLYDDLEGAELKPFKNTFIRGAQIIIGHTLCSRYAGFSYAAKDTDDYFRQSLKEKNSFFAAMGALPPITGKISDHLLQAGKEKAFSFLQDAVKRKKWF